MSVQRTAFKFRIFPTKEQEILLNKTFGCCRFVYNRMIEVQKERFEQNQKHLSKFEASSFCTRELKPKYSFLYEVDKYSLNNAIFNLENAYSKFFKKTGNYPQFKSKRSKQSYTTNRSGNNIRFENGCLVLPKVRAVKIKQHRQIPDNYKLKSVTVSKTGTDKYYASVLFEYEQDIQSVTIDKDKVLGLDFKTSCLYADSEGCLADMPKYYKKMQKKRIREQRKLSKKKQNSNNFYKQKAKAAKVEEKVRNQRNDFLHKRSTQIANEYDLVCVEDLSVKDILQSRKYKNFHKSVLDCGWYNFTQMLSYKLARRGKKLIKVDKSFPSTQLCSVCGKQNTLLSDDSIRKWDCPVCGTHHNRDINAAINIKNEGLRMLGIA